MTLLRARPGSVVGRLALAARETRPRLRVTASPFWARLLVAAGAHPVTPTDSMAVNFSTVPQPASNEKPDAVGGVKRERQGVQGAEGGNERASRPVALKHPPDEMGSAAGSPASWAESGLDQAVFDVQRLSVYYDTVRVLDKVSMAIDSGQVTALIGPDKSGKSTLLRSLNRMNDTLGARTEGKVVFLGRDIYSEETDIREVRRRIGMVTDKPALTRASIYKTVVAGLRPTGTRKERRDSLEAACERALRRAGLWDEVRGRLGDSALTLSGGQQQRLCIARAIAAEPLALLMDEPCARLDPVSTMAVEDMIRELKHEMTIVIVTHNIQQAARVSDTTGFLDRGRLVEFNATDELFSSPSQQATKDYIVSLGPGALRSPPSALSAVTAGGSQLSSGPPARRILSGMPGPRADFRPKIAAFGKGWHCRLDISYQADEICVRYGIIRDALALSACPLPGRNKH